MLCLRSCIPLATAAGRMGHTRVYNMITCKGQDRKDSKRNVLDERVQRHSTTLYPALSDLSVYWTVCAYGVCCISLSLAELDKFACRKERLMIGMRWWSVATYTRVSWSANGGLVHICSVFTRFSNAVNVDDISGLRSHRHRLAYYLNINTQFI